MPKIRARTIGAAIIALLLLVSTTVLAAPYGSRTLHSGTFGGDVIELQRRLVTLGYDIGTPDGLFGARTRAAVMQFQYDYGLVVDGLATKWTMRALDRAFTWHEGSFYTIRAGDSLWSIAQKGGKDYEHLMWLNQLQDTMLYPGQRIRVSWKVANSSAVDPAPNPPVVNDGPRPDYIPALPPSKPPEVPVPNDTPAPEEPVPTSGKTILGYYAEDWIGDRASLNSLKAASGKVNLVVNFSLQIDAKGAITTRDYPDLMAEAKAQGIKVQALVHNYHGSGFDADVARSVLGNAEIRARAVENLVAIARQKGLSGVDVDIENVPPDQRDNYTAFVRELSHRLHQDGLTLSVSIPAKTYDDKTSRWSGAFDYKALGQYADHVVPMTYDEHLPGYPAGPIASLGWVERVTKFAVSQIPPEKVLLGIAGYAYDWKQGTTVGRGLGAPAAMNLAVKNGAAIQWDAVAQVPYFTYNSSGVDRIVYFENADSTAAKLDLVKKYGLGGIAVWRLGLEDPAIWPVVAEKLK